MVKIIQNRTMSITRAQIARQLYNSGGISERQDYGFGSFVKKLTKKVTKPFTKVAKKIVPKELAGIMRVAAPFMGPVAGSLSYLAGTAKQTGRISPVDLALIAAPKIGNIKFAGDESKYARFVPEGLRDRSIREALGDIKVPGTKGEGYRNKSLREVLVGRETTENQLPTSGIFGRGGQQYKLFGGKKIVDFYDPESDVPVIMPQEKRVGILDTKLGQTLFGNKDDVGNVSPNYFKIATAGLTGYKYLQDKKMMEELQKAQSADEAGQTLVNLTGDPDSYQRGVELFNQLDTSAFDIPEQFRLADGGRVNYALGSRPTAEESGLGGLPIEADMRYTGGFMPYGAVEKADDVPARLSKNEFVFTADAVRAAGGGSVNEGAKRMYDMMKNLESQPEAKGAMA